MELNFAAGGRRQGGRGEPGDLAQEFLKRFFVVWGDAFGNAFRRAFGFADEFLGEAGAGGGRQTQGHLAMSGASGDDRIPEVGIGGGQRLRRNFEGGRLSGSVSGNLGEHVLETGLPGFAPVAEFGRSSA